MRKSVKTALALLATTTSIPVMFAPASSATDLGGLTAVTNGNALSTVPSMSDDGNLIVFHTEATNLPGGPTQSGKNVVLYNVSANTFTAITNNVGTSEFPSISGNGRFVAYHYLGDIYVRNIEADGTVGDLAFKTETPNDAEVYAEVANDGTVVYESKPEGAAATDPAVVAMTTPAGVRTQISDGTSAATAPSISDDGSTVAYLQDTGGVTNLFVYDVAAGTATQRTNGDNDTMDPAVNADGSVIAFGSDAHNLPGAAATGGQNIFTLSGSTIKRLTNSGVSSQLTDVSADGNFVVFTSKSTDFSSGADVNGQDDLFRVQVSNAATLRLSNDANGFGGYATTNGDGSKAAFATLADNQVPGLNGNGNVVRWGATDITPTAPIVTPPTPTTPPATQGDCLTEAPDASLGFALTSTPSDRNTLYRAYCVTLLRWPDLGGFEYWLGVRNSGVSWEFIEATIADSPEFRARYGTLDNNAFVERIYVDVLKRGSDPEGLAYWQGLLNSGQLDRGQILFYFSDSQEFKNKTGTA